MSPMVRRPPGMEIALLGFLRQSPQHGYQIHLKLSDPEGLGPIWYLKQSQLYALLGKLENDGYIWGELEAQDPGRPARRVFHLTKTGRTLLAEWLKSPVLVPRLMRQEFIAKYYFARLEGEEQARALVALQRAICQKWLEDVSAEETEPSSFKSIIREYRIGQIRSNLQWLESR